MRRPLLTMLLVLLVSSARAQEPRKPHPFIPSIPELTEEEEKKLDEIIDRFILYDTGRLRGAEGQQALRDFQALGIEAVPALIRGLNRAATLNHSCPVTVIAGKLQRFFSSTLDPKMLEFARDEIGIGVRASVHGRVLQDLRFVVNNRRNALARAGVRPGGPAAPAVRSLSTAAIIQEVSKERGERLRSLLTELGQRNGEDVIHTLGISAASYERENQQAARTALVAVLTRLKLEDLKTRLTDEKAEVRLAAVKVVSNRSLCWGAELIARLDDEDAGVREWARETLGRLANRTVDFGPARNATREQRQLAIEKWRNWWERQGGR